MANVIDQRSRRQQSKTSAESWADTPTTPQKEAPAPAETIAKGAKGKAPMPFSLLSSLPSPARNLARSQPGPCGPPTYAPTALSAPSVPPPPMMPAPPCQAPNMMNMAMPEQPQLGSYRDRLRAGGAGAFQRAFQSGLVPKAMKQDWNTGYNAQMQGQGYNMPQEAQIQNGAGMQYSMVGDSQQAWYGAGQAAGPDCLGILMNQSQMPPPQQQQLQQNSQMVQQMPAQAPMQYFQVPQPQPSMQMASFTDGEQGQMQMASMQMASMQLPQMPVAEMGESTPTMSGYSTPSECMSIVMPHVTEHGVPEDLDAYLKAAAAANDGYED